MILSAVALAVSATRSTPVAVATQVEALTDRLETGFRACALQVTKRDYLTGKNATELAGVGIELSDHAPTLIQMIADKELGGPGLFASVKSDTGKVWLVASQAKPICKVTISDSDLALSARVALTRRFRSAPSWSFDPSRSGNNGNFQRDVLILNEGRPGSHMALLFDGPNIISQNGAGMQLIMTVALVAAPAP